MSLPRKVHRTFPRSHCFIAPFPRAAPPGAPTSPGLRAANALLADRLLRLGSARFRARPLGLRLLFRLSASDFGLDFALDFGFWLDLAGFDLDFGWIWLDLAFIHLDFDWICFDLL